LVSQHRAAIVRILIGLLLGGGLLLGYSDSDFDGVSDDKDDCPNTPITNLVDRYGCSIIKIMDNDPMGSQYDVILGYIYDRADYGTSEDIATLTNTFQVDAFMENWGAELFTSYFVSDANQSERSGMNDTTLSLYYGYRALEEYNIFLRLRLGAIFPTKKSHYNKMDYLASLSANVIINGYALFGGYTYTFVGDEDIEFYEFQNTHAFHVGAGYYIKANIYMSLSYLYANSIVKQADNIRSASLYLFYGINTNWFATLSYSQGLSSSTSDLASNLRIGYYFQ